LEPDRTPEDGWKRHACLLWLAASALLAAVLWWALDNPYLNVANDSGRYMVLGESLARNGSLRLINEVGAPLDTLYPPGLPAIIAFWLRLTHAGPGGVVVPVKFTNLLLLIGSLPLMVRLLRRSGLTDGNVAAGLLLMAAAPALIYYAADVMSEVPFLCLCLVSVALVERDTRSGAEDCRASPASRIAALVAAACAFLVRTVGIGLLVAEAIWFWRRFGWRWGLGAAVVSLILVGGWQRRNRHIIAHAPPGSAYTTYLDQFALRDPMDPRAGRIDLDASGLFARAGSGMPTYVAMVPRAVLWSMSATGPAFWRGMFYAIAVPLGAVILFGFGLAWRRGLGLSSLFSAIFWLMAAMWPWRDPRFVVPLVPYFLVFMLLGADWMRRRAARTLGRVPADLGVAAAACVLFLYFGHVYAALVASEQARTPAGYTFGRNKAEAGFYAACRWIHDCARPGVVMGRPAYILHLYSGHPTVQIEPTLVPRVEEGGFVRPERVRYLVQDRWSWSNTQRYLAPYLEQYGDRWTLAWQDPLGSGVRIWERRPERLSPR
jgi:hypothetical protein